MKTDIASNCSGLQRRAAKFTHDEQTSTHTLAPSAVTEPHEEDAHPKKPTALPRGLGQPAPDKKAWHPGLLVETMVYVLVVPGTRFTFHKPAQPVGGVMQALRIINMQVMRRMRACARQVFC